MKIEGGHGPLCPRLAEVYYSLVTIFIFSKVITALPLFKQKKISQTQSGKRLKINKMTALVSARHL